VRQEQDYSKMSISGSAYGGKGGWVLRVSETGLRIGISDDESWIGFLGMWFMARDDYHDVSTLV
jgi:hypothetical protein